MTYDIFTRTKRFSLMFILFFLPSHLLIDLFIVDLHLWLLALSRGHIKAWDQQRFWWAGALWLFIDLFILHHLFVLLLNHILLINLMLDLFKRLG